MKEGVAKTPLVHQNHAEADLLGLDGAGETGRTGAHDQHVKLFLQDTTAVLHLYSLDDEPPGALPVVHSKHLESL
jgi:hypothetical protein